MSDLSDYGLAKVIKKRAVFVDLFTRLRLQTFASVSCSDNNRSIQSMVAAESRLAYNASMYF